MSCPTHDLAVVEIGGVRTLVVSPSIPEDAPSAVREGIARRRIVNAGGTCPCGARLRLPGRADRRRARRHGEVLRSAPARHADDCPAADDVLAAAMRGA
ncbi:MAG: hypothetical protein NTW05_09365 [Pseudonocardiales bacterium]|nr:hypothetical protein [Pseudonocardiales bacterium]